jgi:hypothetical protein
MQTSAEVTYGRAVRRLEEKLGYLQKKIDEDPDDERRNYYSRLDLAVFELCLDCLKFAEQYARYEDANNKST